MKVKVFYTRSGEEYSAIYNAPLVQELNEAGLEAVRSIFWNDFGADTAIDGIIEVK
jgi:hypothetical protein